MWYNGPDYYLRNLECENLRSEIQSSGPAKGNSEMEEEVFEKLEKANEED